MVLVNAFRPLYKVTRNLVLVFVGVLDLPLHFIIIVLTIIIFVIITVIIKVVVINFIILGF